MTGEINLNSLLPRTKSVLEKLVLEAGFLSGYVFVGGSALSVRLAHRLSEDLDFFTYDDAFDKNGILDFFRGKQHQIINETKDQLDFLYEGVKVTFFNARWPFLRPDTLSRLNVASMPQLAAMKIHTLFVRATFRDYYDIYTLSFHMSLQEMYCNAQMLMEGLNYKLFSMALVYVDDIIDENISHLSPVHQITKKDISEHFISLLKEQNTN
jgi:predicted nucleotidyltransferase component of viral defense system